MRRLAVPLAGLILVAAGLLKLHELRDSSQLPDYFARDWFLQLALSLTEVGAGCWLLASVAERTARWAAVGVFGTFAGVAAVKAAAGLTDCGCLGAVRVHPLVMASVDVAVAALCWLSRPPARPLSVGWTVGLAGAVGTLLAGLGLAAHTGATRVARGVVFVELVHHAGRVPEGQEVVHPFAVRNRLAEAVEITRTASSCGCSTTDVEAGQIIQPGETLAVPVRLNTAEAEGELVGGVTLFARPVGSRGPAVPVGRVRLAAEVVPDYIVDPNVIDFGPLAPGYRPAVEVRLIPRGATAVRVLAAHSSNPVFEAGEWVSQPDGSVRGRVTAGCPDGSGAGAVQGTIRLTTDSPRRRATEVVLRASYRPPLVCSPTGVAVGSDVAGEVVKELTLRADRPFEVHDLTVGDLAVGVVAETAGRRTEHRLRLTVAPVTGRFFSTDVCFTAVFAAGDGSPALAHPVRVPVVRFPESSPPSR